MTAITLTTDFGGGSPYVAEMKGAILAIQPQARIVDVTHDVPPQNVLEAALVLQQIAPAFPRGAIHVAVVDPGVGTNRAILLVSVKGQHFLGPDNGLLSPLIDPTAQVRVVDQPAYWRDPVSATFHGRDIMGPVAAHLASGIAPAAVSSVWADRPVALAIPPVTGDDSSLDGQILRVDSFGNLISNLSAADLQQARAPYQIQFQGKAVKLVTTYAEAEPGETIALLGSSGWLELAVSQGHAGRILGAGVGDVVRLIRHR